MSDETPAPPRLLLLDGEVETELVAEALAVALFATVPDALKAQVIAMAKALTAELAKGQAIKLQTQRIARPTGSVLP